MEDELRSLVADFRQWALAEKERGVHVEWVDDPKGPQQRSEQLPQRANSVDPWAQVAADARRKLEDAGASLKGQVEHQYMCTRCQIPHCFIWGWGSDQADLLIVNETFNTPDGHVEPPFAGESGEMLLKMLENVLGLQADNVCVATLIKCRPPKNRTHMPQDVIACRDFLERQRLLTKPKLILVMGNVAYNALMDSTEGVLRNRGQWQEWAGVPVMPTFHPTYLLRNSDDKRLTFRDLKSVRARYDSVNGKRG